MHAIRVSSLQKETCLSGYKYAQTDPLLTFLSSLCILWQNIPVRGLNVEKTISSQLLFCGKVITVRVDEVLLENGCTSRREVVEHAGAAAVLAITKDKEALFVRQYRKPIEQELLEIPAGKLEKGEDPAKCAARELAEETGMQAGRIQELASYYSSPGFASEKLTIFLAGELSPAQAEKPDDEILQVLRLPFAEALAMARDGRLQDGKTIIALLLAERLLTD